MENRAYRLGLVSVSFRAHSPEEIIRAAKDAGLDLVEWGSDVHAPCKDAERLTYIAALQRQYGIACSSYGTYFRLGQTPLSELPDYIRAARILETDVLRVWCGNKSGADMTSAERETLFAECSKAAEIAKQHGVVLCTECHRGTFTERAKDTVALMQEVDSPYFRTYWQPFQWLDSEQSLAVAKEIAPYTEHVHVFNWKENGKFPLANAIEDWKHYLGALPAPRTLLLEFMPDGRIESLPAEAKALRMITGRQI